MEPGQGGDAPMITFGIVLAGTAGGAIMTATAILSQHGNNSGGITATPRTTYALARDGLLPAWFATVSERFRTPANSVMFMGSLIAILALTGSFVWLAVVSTLARMIVYSISIASLPRTERPGLGGWLLIAAGIGVCLWIALQSQWPSWRMLLILAAGGTILYFVARGRAKRSA
jgi:amino acid transporter